MKTRIKLALGLTTALAFTLSACGGGDDDAGDDATAGGAPTTVEEVLAGVEGMDPEAREAQLLEWAKNEDGFVWYAALQADSADAISAAYQKAYPDVNMTTNGGKGGGALFEQAVNEAQANQYRWDVLIANPEHLKVLRELDLPTPYSGPNFDLIPDDYKDPDGEWVDFYVIRMVMIYNTNVVAPEDVPTSYEDLTDPKWKGKFAVDTEDFEWSNFIDQTDPGLLEQLGANDPVMIRGGGTIRENVASGEVPLGVSLGDYLVWGMIEDGAPVEMVYPEPTLVKHGPMLLGKHAPNPANAVLFFDWALSTEGQQAMHDSTARAYVNPDVVNQFPGLEERYSAVGEFRSVDVNEFAEDYEEIVTRLGDLFGQ